MRGLARKSPPSHIPIKLFIFPSYSQAMRHRFTVRGRLTGEGPFLECLDVPPAEAAHFI